MSMAGKLRTRVSFKAVNFDRNGMGAAKKVEVQIADAWATVEAVRGQERFDAQKRGVEATTVVTVRYFSDLDVLKEKDRIVYIRNGVTRRLDILHIENVLERNREIILTCKKRAK